MGIVFSILTFLGVFTLVLRPLFDQMGLSYPETDLPLLASVVVVIVGFGVFLDRYIRLGSAQASVETVWSLYLVDLR